MPGTRKLFLLLTLAITMGSALAEDETHEYETGLRTATGHGVDSLEIYMRWPAPFVQEHILEPYLPAGGTARWDTALSYWKGGNDHAVVFAIGPTVEYPLPYAQWGLTLGIQPTLFSDYESDNRNLGGPFEFTSHVGVRWRPRPDWYLGARVQHTSNAGIYDSNPGVDLFAVELGSRF